MNPPSQEEDAKLVNAAVIHRLVNHGLGDACLVKGTQQGSSVKDVKQVTLKCMKRRIIITIRDNHLAIVKAEL